MKTHPKIKALLASDLSKESREAIEQADEADKISRAYHGHGSSFIPDKRYVLALAHATLLKEGVTQVAGQDVDVFLLRFLRDHHHALSESRMFP